MLYFAWVREAIGTSEEVVAPPAGTMTVAMLIDWLAQRDDAHADALRDRTKLRAAVDGVFVTPDEPIGAAREVAIFPPVTGG